MELPFAACYSTTVFSAINISLLRSYPSAAVIIAINISLLRSWLSQPSIQLRCYKYIAPTELKLVTIKFASRRFR
jgi:hypothetical protein